VLAGRGVVNRAPAGCCYEGGNRNVAI